MTTRPLPTTRTSSGVSCSSSYSSSNSTTSGTSANHPTTTSTSGSRSRNSKSKRRSKSFMHLLQLVTRHKDHDDDLSILRHHQDDHSDDSSSSSCSANAYHFDENENVDNFSARSTQERKELNGVRQCEDLERSKTSSSAMSKTSSHLFSLSSSREKQELRSLESSSMNSCSRSIVAATTVGEENPPPNHTSTIVLKHVPWKSSSSSCAATSKGSLETAQQHKHGVNRRGTEKSLMITNLSHLNQSQKQRDLNYTYPRKERERRAGQVSSGNLSVSGKSYSSIKSNHSRKLQEVDVARTVLLQVMEEEKQKQQSSARHKNAMLRNHVDSDSVSVVSSYTVHDILDDLTGCEDLDGQSVRSFRSCRSSRSTASRRRKKIEKGMEGQNDRTQTRNASAIGRGTNMLVMGGITASVPWQGWEDEKSVATASHLSYEARLHRGRSLSKTSKSNTKSRSKSGTSLPSGRSYRIRNPEEGHGARVDEAERLYHSFVKNLTKQQLLEHDTKVLSNASNVRAALQAQKFSQKFKALEVQDQTREKCNTWTKHEPVGSSSNWAVDLFQQHQDWSEFERRGRDTITSRDKPSSLVHDTSSVCSIAPSVGKCKGTNQSQELTSSTVVSTRSQDLQCRDFSSTSGKFKDSTSATWKAFESKDDDRQLTRFENEIRSVKTTPRYTFVDDTKVLKRIQKKSVVDSPSRASSAPTPRTTAIHPAKSFVSSLATSHNQVVSDHSILSRPTSANAAINEVSPPALSKRQDLKQNDNDDFDLFECKNDVSADGTDDVFPDPFKTALSPPRPKVTHEASNQKYATKQCSASSRDGNKYNQLRHDSGWEGFVTSRNFESIPSGWDSEEEESDDESETQNTVQVMHGIPLTNKSAHRSGFSETSPTCVAEFESATATEWLKGTTTNNLQPPIERRELFSDDMFHEDFSGQWL